MLWGGTEPKSWVIEAESFNCDTPVSKNLVMAKFRQDAEAVDAVVAYSDMTEAEIMALDYIDVSAIAALNQRAFDPATLKAKPLGVSAHTLYSASSSNDTANLATDTNAIDCLLTGWDTIQVLVILPTNADVRFNCK